MSTMLALALALTPAGMPAEPAIVGEARAFMASYARDLVRADRAAIAARYSRRGAWSLGNGRKALRPQSGIRDDYASAGWRPPAAFAWRELAFEPLGADAVVVVGLFDWTVKPGAPPLRYSYTGLLRREDGVLRIRVEDESRGAPAAP